jgi:uncharacterized protein YdeI (YjbR/CyaY-like superfamily)
MRPRGEAEVRRAQDDGRWERAYAGPASITVPDDLAAAFAEQPAAREAFDRLGAQDRFAILFGVVTAATEPTRARRIRRAITTLLGDDPG